MEPQTMGAGMGQEMATQSGQGGMGTGMQMGTGMRLSDVETVQQRTAVESISRAIQVCEFCADQCIQMGDPHMAECIRLCRDVSELGRMSMALIPRNSRYAETALHAFTQALDDCARECGSHQDAHCLECAEVLPKTIDSIQQHLQFSR